MILRKKAIDINCFRVYSEFKINNEINVKEEIMNKEENLLRVGILGCGPISQLAHFEASNRAKNVELYAICDLADDLLSRMKILHHPKVTYSDYDEMLADPNIDAVIIGIADQFHVDAAIKAIDAGKHVLVEKPLGVSVEECERLREKVIESGLILQIGNMKRFDPGIAYARKFIQEEIGELIGLKAWYCDSTYRYTVTDNIQPLTQSSKNAKKPEGNPKQDKLRYFMLTHGSHLVDTARFLGGNIVSVKAWNTQKFGAYCWFVTAEFENGFVGQLDLTMSVRMDWHEGFQIYGENGSVIGKTYNPWYFKSSDVEIFSTKDASYRRPLGEDAHFYRLQIEGFADAILHKKPILGANIEDGVAVMRTMVAIARSVETGETIRLSDVSGGL
jgi:predicted dehydrogenase